MLKTGLVVPPTPTARAFADEPVIDSVPEFTIDVPTYKFLGLVAPLAPMSYVLSVKSRLPVNVPPAKGRYAVLVYAFVPSVPPSANIEGRTISTSKCQGITCGQSLPCS